MSPTLTCCSCWRCSSRPFGWGASGYAHVDGLLAGYAPWIGAYGLCALSAWLAMTIPQAFACGPWQRVAALLVLTLPSVAQMDGAGFSSGAGRLSVTLLQGNIPQTRSSNLERA